MLAGSAASHSSPALWLEYLETRISWTCTLWHLHNPGRGSKQALPIDWIQASVKMPWVWSVAQDIWAVQWLHMGQECLASILLRHLAHGGETVISDWAGCMLVVRSLATALAEGTPDPPSAKHRGCLRHLHD